MPKQKTKIFILILILVILILVGFILYAFVLKPSFSGYVIKKQVEAQTIVLTAMLQQIQQQGYTQITGINGDQTLVLVPFNADAQPGQPTQQVNQAIPVNQENTQDPTEVIA